MTSYLFSFRGPRDSVLLPETFDAWPGGNCSWGRA